MNLTDCRLKQLDDSPPASHADILRRCRQASDLIHAGQYESAGEALGEFWQGVGVRPEVERLDETTGAEVLMQCGALSGWLGRRQHIPGAQEAAKDLLSESLRIFESHAQPSRASEAQYELGMCYFRLGAYDEARVVLDEALRGLRDTDTDLRAKILIRHTLVEVWTGRYRDAWDILREAESFFEGCGDAIKGRWHGQKGLVLQRLALTEKRPDYADRAIMEFEAAIFHYELAGHERYCANNLNNLAMLLYQLGRHAEAHDNLDRAEEIFERHRDPGSLAQVRETRSRVLVAEGRYEEASRLVSRVIQTFEQGGDAALLADALTIQGRAWARTGRHEDSVEVLRRAMTLANEAGSFSNAGNAALTLIEEHGRERLSEAELYDIYLRADDLLRSTQDAEEIARLRACANVVTRRLGGARLHDEGFVLHDVILSYEGKFIREALAAEHGSVSRAARRLGIRYQSLAHILKTRHTDLLELRLPAKPRKRSFIRREQRPEPRETQKAAATILHVEDFRSVAEIVRDTLEMEGWGVETCADGAEALKRILSDARYDLLILDYDLPHVDGLELVRRTRLLAHRKRTPVIMLSGSDIEPQAWRAGVDAFLSKPDDIKRLGVMVARLLAKPQTKIA
ncbi:MAG TPA: response regulator [Pyrinomonadaceae bacterium]|nr:response regulator [Pyrinomonadaceae bacterium]